MSKSTIVSAHLYDVIKKPLITEKTYKMADDDNKAIFEVAIDATKPLIKEAVEAIFNVKVEKVNTLVSKGKTKKFRGMKGKRKDRKKAMIVLAEGNSIDFAS